MKTTQTTSFHFIAIFILALLFSTGEKAYATHAAGGEITYTHLNGNCYSIRLTFFRDCLGIAIVQPILVNIASASCAQSTSLQLNPIAGTGQEITYPCPGHATTCTGGSEPGLQKWEFEAQYCFPGQCADWNISITISARNAAITTLVNPGGDDIYIEANLNNLNGDNSSPQFAINPNLFLCIGQDIIINNGAVDPDGDSLAFTMIAPRTAANTPVVYNAGYSIVQPLSSQSQITLNPVTGDLSIHPTAAEVGVIAYLIEDFRNGVLVGSVMRDLQYYTVPCTNQIPTITGVNGSPVNTMYVLAQQPFCFNVFCYDTDSGDSLTMLSNNGIPTGVFSVQAAIRPTGVFCWTPTLADVSAQPHVFTVTVLDQNCPAQGIAANYFSIYVTTDSSLVTPLNTNGYFSGNVFYDENSNGIKDGAEVNAQNLNIFVQPDLISLFTNSLGEYLFYTPTIGSHTITINPIPGWIITSDSTIYTVANDSTDQSGFDFGINAINPENGLSLAIMPGFPRCNFDKTYYLNYENTGTSVLDGRIVFVLDNAVSFVQSVPTPDQISGDSLIYNYTNFWPFSTNFIQMVLHLPGGGDTIHFEAIAQYDSSGTYVTSDVQSFQQIVTCSFDPNDKLVFPEGLFSDHRTLYDEELQYTIRFQNTGTDTAFLVFIHDYIDQNLDISTLHITGYSHPMSTMIFANRMVEFKFENILLPDSNVDEPGSHGYVQYKIRPMPNLQLPTVVQNEADIFFDSNFPVITNNVWNTLVSDLSVDIPSIVADEEQILVIPNPVHHLAEIRFGKSFANIESQFRIFDAMGRLVDNRMVNASSIQISRGNLQTGIYFLELKNNISRATGRFVIE